MVLGGAVAMIFFFQRNRPVAAIPIVIEATKKSNWQPSKFSLEEAPADSLRGEIISLTGEVEWQSRIATEPGQLPVGIKIQQGEKLVTKESGNIAVKFAAAGTMTMFPEAEVEIVQTLPVNLVFNQLKGKTRYLVGGSSLLSVRNFNLIVNVSSGLITIKTDIEAGEVTLSLKAGQATVAYNSPEFESKRWELEPGDDFVFYNEERKGYFKADL